MSEAGEPSSEHVHTLMSDHAHMQESEHVHTLNCGHAHTLESEHVYAHTPTLENGNTPVFENEHTPQSAHHPISPLNKFLIKVAGCLKNDDLDKLKFLVTTNETKYVSLGGVDDIKTPHHFLRRLYHAKPGKNNRGFFKTLEELLRAIEKIKVANEVSLFMKNNESLLDVEEDIEKTLIPAWESLRLTDEITSFTSPLDTLAERTEIAKRWMKVAYYDPEDSAIVIANMLSKPPKKIKVPKSHWLGTLQKQDIFQPYINNKTVWDPIHICGSTYVAASLYQGRFLITLRRMYLQDNQLHHSALGISLTPTTWDRLVTFFEKLKNKYKL